MEELEVGMYVRTDIGIGRITSFEIDLININLGYRMTIDYKSQMFDIKKYSHNIIDLIEVGDHLKFVDVFGRESYVIVDETFKILKPHQLKEILTHEQYENNIYRIGE